MSMATTIHPHLFSLSITKHTLLNNTNTCKIVVNYSKPGRTIESFQSPHHQRSRNLKAKEEEEDSEVVAWPQRRAAITAIQNSHDLPVTLHRVGDNLYTQDLNMIIRHFGRLRKWEEVCQLFDWMQKHGNVSASSYTSFVMLMGKGGLPKNALKMYNNLNDETVKSNVFVCNAMLKCLISNGRIENAFKLFEQMQKGGLVPDIITYSTLLAGCVKARRGYSKAQDLLEEVKKKGLKLDSVMYGSLLALCASYGRDEEAEAHFQHMKIKGLSVNEFHYSSLLNAYAAKGKYEKAEKLVDEMKSAGLVPNKVVLNSLLKVYSKSGHFEKAMEVLAELDAIGHASNEMPHCTIMDGLAKAGKLQEAQRIFDEMKAKGIKSDGHSYSTMISAYSKFGKIEEVRKLAEEMENIEVKYDLVMMNTLLKAYSDGYDMESVMQTLKKMDDLKISPDRKTFSTLVSYFCKEKLYDLALRTLEDMQIRGLQPTEEICSSLITGLAANGQAEEAFKVYNKIKHNRHPLSNTLQENIFNILISGKMLREAHMVMKDNVKSFSEASLNKFVVSFAESGNIYTVIDVLRDFHNAGYKLKERVFNVILFCYIKQGKKRELIQLLKWMKNQGYKVAPRTLNSVLKSFQGLGQLDIAEMMSLSRKHSVPS